MSRWDWERGWLIEFNMASIPVRGIWFRKAQFYGKQPLNFFFSVRRFYAQDAASTLAQNAMEKNLESGDGILIRYKYCTVYSETKACYLQIYAC